MKTLTVLTADCPWMWEDTMSGNRGASAHLDGRTLDALCDTALPPLTQDAVLFLWRPASRLADALAVVQAWGFTPKTELVWVKVTKHGARAFGMGHTLRGEHETCIIAHRGKPAVSSHSVRSTFTAPAVPYGKPPEFYSVVRELYPHASYYDRTAGAWGKGWQHTENLESRAITLLDENRKLVSASLARRTSTPSR